MNLATLQTQLTDLESRLASVQNLTAGLTDEDRRMQTTIDQNVSAIQAALGMTKQTTDATAGQTQETASKVDWLWLALAAVALLVAWRMFQK